MSSLGQLDTEGPELVFGIVAPSGAPVARLCSDLGRLLVARGYQATLIRLSEFLESVDLASGAASGSSEFVRVMDLMSKGDRLRESAERNDILALNAAAQINSRRSEGELNYSAFILRQLKRPEEVYRLRQIYGDSFHVLGLYAPISLRKSLLKNAGMTDDEVSTLIERDDHESIEFGQKLRGTFHLADIFFEMTSADDSIDDDIERFLHLLFGTEIVTPTRDEYGMFLAAASALRSAQLSRQVGAAILTSASDVVALGCNEVPAFPGGQYWGDEGGDCGEPLDARDHVRGEDSSDRMKYDIIEEILPRIDGNWSKLTDDEQQQRIEETISSLDGTRVMSLTEFGRAVHAEMEAICSAARRGVSVGGTTLYTTTFPCHGCAKHIVGAGIKRTVYIEPYPKSLAPELHQDSIAIDQESAMKCTFQPFCGIAPRRYADFFVAETREGKKIRRKDETGRVIADALGMRLYTSPHSYLALEAAAAQELLDLSKEEES